MTLKQKIKHLVYTRFPGKAGRMTYFGSQLHFPVESHLFKRLCQEGIYECEIINQLISFVPQNGVVFDVGANIGLTALPILNQRPNCTLHSFEPSPSSFPFLKETWNESPFRPRWSVNCLALSDEPGEVSFFTHGKGGSAFDGMADNNRAECANPATEVKVTADTLDHYVDSKNFERIDLIKIDVEGFESSVLKGATKTIKRFRPIIALEWTDANLKGRAHDSLFTIATDLDAELFTIPSLVKISTELECTLRMRTIENFILIPR